MKKSEVWQNTQFGCHVASVGFLLLTSVGAGIIPDAAKLFTAFVGL